MKLSIKAKNCMTAPVVTISSDKTIRDAAVKMWKHKIGSLIIDSKGTYDIITERDILKAVAENKLDYTLNATMEDPLITIDEDAPLGKVAQMMLLKKIRHLAVTNGSESVIGILTIRDVVLEVHETFLSLFEA